MPKLTITIDIEADSVLEDPHDVAANVVDEYNLWAHSNHEPRAEFVSAEWED